MFSSGDMSMFLILDKAEMDSCTEGTNDGQWFPTIAQASGHQEPYSVTQYCRLGNEEDPWLSVEEHPTQVVYGEGSFNVPAWCDSRGQLAPDLSAHPEVSEIGTLNGVTLYKVPMTPGPMTNSRIEKTCGRLGLLTPCYVVGNDHTGEQWSGGNCEAIPGAPPQGACPYGDSCPYLPETIATQIFGCSSVGSCQGGNTSPGNDGQMEGLFTVIYNHMDNRPCAIIDGGYCHESEPVYQSTAERQLYGVCSFAVGVGSCPANCWTGTAGDGMCPNTCEHCNDDAIMGHGGANVWVHEIAAPGSGHRRLEKNTTATEVSELAPIGVVEVESAEPSEAAVNATKRQLQAAESCSMTTIQPRLDVVNTACCPADASCANGLPAACNIECAIIYTKFYDECCALPTHSFCFGVFQGLGRKPSHNAFPFLKPCQLPCRPVVHIVASLRRSFAYGNHRRSVEPGRCGDLRSFPDGLPNCVRSALSTGYNLICSVLRWRFERSFHCCIEPSIRSLV